MRKEKERQEKEARRVAREESVKKDDGKRRAEVIVGEDREAKRAKSGEMVV